MFGFGVVIGWVLEFTVVVFFGEFGLSLLAYLDKLINMLLISKILVQIILKMLNLIHVPSNLIIFSNPLKSGESFVI